MRFNILHVLCAIPNAKASSAKKIERGHLRRKKMENYLGRRHYRGEKIVVVEVSKVQEEVVTISES